MWPDDRVIVGIVGIGVQLYWTLVTKRRVERSLVWQPTLDLRWTGKTGSSYLHCTEVGMKVRDRKSKIYMKEDLAM